MSGEPPNVYSLLTPKARKRHKCGECRGFIEPGEKYQLLKGLWDGSWGDYKTCLDCVELRSEVDNDQRSDERPAFGEMFDYIFDDEDGSPDRVFRFMDIRRKRNAPESPRRWMEEREQKLIAANA